MAAHLPELDATGLDKLVDFSIAQDIKDPKDFEHIHPEQVSSNVLNGLSFGLQAALVKYVKAMYKPTLTTVPHSGAHAMHPGHHSGPRAVIALQVDGSTDLENVDELLKQFDPAEVANPATQEVFKSLCLGDLSPDIMPPADAAQAAQKATRNRQQFLSETSDASEKAIFYDKPISAKFSPVWAQAEEVAGAAPDSSASVHFGSVFGFFAALLRFLLMTVTLDTAGRSMWDVPLPEGSPHAAGPVERSGGHARRLGRMYNYMYTLLEVAHRSQQESTSNGKKVRAHVLRLCVSPNFGRG